MTFAAVIRDISIIMVALESFVIMAMLGILIWQVYKLVKMMQTEIRPIIQDTQETLATLRGTTNFMTENVVNPVVETSSKIAGYRRTLQVLAGDRVEVCFDAPLRNIAPGQGAVFYDNEHCLGGGIIERED